MKRAFLVAALLSAIGLLVRSERVGLAGDYVDPVSKITARDEALYANSSIRMATQGDWLTPRFMGRFALYKPPLLFWTSALSARLLGVSRFSLRLPTVVACGVAAGLIFLWAAEMASWPVAVGALLLLITSHLWNVLGALAMTDGLLVSFYTGALYALFRDPWLESRVAFWGFAGSAAAAILTKGIAGAPLLAILGLYVLTAPRNYRPAWRTVFQVTLAAAALAAPWFLYQTLAHGRWFSAAQSELTIPGFGVVAPPTARGNHFLYYVMSTALLDPMLTAFTLVSLPGLLLALRRRSAEAVLLASWLAVAAGVPLVWQDRNASYLLPLLPALAVMSVAYAPRIGRRQAVALLTVISIGALAKLATPAAPWGISFQRGTIQPVAPALSTYCKSGRANGLVIVDAVDDLYASALSLPALHYAVAPPQSSGIRNGVPFERLGIAVTVDEFRNLEHLRPLFLSRLREWKLDTAEPIASLVIARSPQELGALIRESPSTDFLLPDRYRSTFADSGHTLIPAGDYSFLLAPEPVTRPSAPARTCEM
jgi:hypothetical protein